MTQTSVSEPLPATAKGRETRQRLIEAAAELMFARGVANVSIDDIRQATGTSKSQIYHYFTGKSDLVRAVIDRQLERILQIHRVLAGSLSSWDDMERWRDGIVAAQRERECRRGCPLGSLANELSELDDAAREQLSSAFASWEQQLANGLGGMVEAGVLRPDVNPSTLALSTMASLQGGLLLAETDRDARPLEVALDAAIAHIKSFAQHEASATP